MRPLNGERAMTREERNARRRELDRNPFHLALSHKVRKAWRDRNKEKINARRLAKYALNREAESERRKAYHLAHPEKRKEAWKRYVSKPENRAYLRERDRKRSKESIRRKIGRRKERMRTDKRYAAKIRWEKRFNYHRHKHDAIGIRAMLRQEWIAKWTSVVAAGEERIEKYLGRCGIRVRSFFGKWRRAGMPTDLDKALDALGYVRGQGGRR